MAGDAELSEQGLHGRDLVGFVGNVDMGKHKSGVGGECAEHLGGQGFRIHLQTERQGCLRTNASADPAKPGALDRLVKLECIAPERLVAISIIAKDVSPVLDVGRRILDDRVFGHQGNRGIRDRGLSIKRASDN